MSSPPCCITVDQTCASASNQPELHITHIYTTNPDASDSSPAELSAAAKAVVVQQQAKQKEGSTSVIRRSYRQRKQAQYFPPMDVRILAGRKRRQRNAARPFVCSLFSFPPQTTQIIEFRAKNLIIEKDHPNPPPNKKPPINKYIITNSFFFYVKKKKGFARCLGIY